MTEMETIFGFWRRFSLPAFERNTVPVKAEEGAFDYPYLTFEMKTDHFGREVPLAASLWYRSSSYAEAEEKQREIAEYIGRGGIFLPCRDGVIWLKRGSPFACFTKDDEADAVKRMDLNISVEFLAEE